MICPQEEEDQCEWFNSSVKGWKGLMMALASKTPFFYLEIFAYEGILQTIKLYLFSGIYLVNPRKYNNVLIRCNIYICWLSM